MNGRILVIDDEPEIRESFEALLIEAGYDVVTAGDYGSATEALSKSSFDVVFADLSFGPQTGIDILREVKKGWLSTQVIIIAGTVDIATAGEAVRMGAFDYVPKPVTKTMLLRLADQSLRHKRTVESRETYRRTLEATFKCVYEAILAIDSRMTILAANDAIENFFQRPPGILSARNFPMLPATRRSPFWSMWLKKRCKAGQ